MAVTMNENANSSEHTLAGGPPPHVAGLAVRSLDQLTDPVVDPRVRLETRPDAEELDEGLVTQLSDVLHTRGTIISLTSLRSWRKGLWKARSRRFFM